ARLVETRERGACTQRLHLGDDVVVAVRADLVGTLQLAERRVVVDRDHALAGGEGLRRGELEHTGNVDLGGGEHLLLAVGGRVDRLGNGKPLAVHPDRIGRPGDVDADVHMAREPRLRRIDGQRECHFAGDDGARQRTGGNGRIGGRRHAGGGEQGGGKQAGTQGHQGSREEVNKRPAYSAQPWPRP